MPTKNKPKRQSKALREPIEIGKIIEAAFVLLNEVGLPNMTTRRLADKLGIRSASLYWHIRDKDELLQLMAEDICSILSPLDVTLPWKEQIRTFACDYRTTLLSIRDSAEILLETPPFTPKRLSLMDGMLHSMSLTQLLKKEALMAAMTINDYILGFVKNEIRTIDVSNSGEAMSDEFFHTISPQQYPNVALYADSIITLNNDEHFMFGLNLLLGTL